MRQTVLTISRSISGVIGLWRSYSTSNHWSTTTQFSASLCVSSASTTWYSNKITGLGCAHQEESLTSTCKSNWSQRIWLNSIKWLTKCNCSNVRSCTSLTTWRLISRIAPLRSAVRIWVRNSRGFIDLRISARQPTMMKMKKQKKKTLIWMRWSGCIRISRTRFSGDACLITR